MRTRLLVLGLAAGLGIAALPAHAAKVTPQITDPAGDANAINDQGFGTGAPPSTSGPGSQPAADITALTFQTTFKKKRVDGKKVKVPSGSTITLALSAAPDDNTFYSIDATTPSCDSTGFVYDTNAVPAYAQNRALCADDTPSSDIAGPVAKVVGSSIVWTLPLTTFPVGTTFTDISATTLTGAVPAVVLDTTDESPATFTVGS